MVTIRKIGKIPNNIIITKVTEAKVIIGNREVGFIIEVTIREAEVIIRMIRDKIPGAEATEEVMAMNKVKTIIDWTTNVVEAVVPFVDHREPMEITQGDVDLPHQVLGIHNTKEYHNIDTYVVFVIAEDIMTISVIPSNIYFMLCNNRVVNRCHNQILNIKIQIKMTNQLFKAGIPQP